MCTDSYKCNVRRCGVLGGSKAHMAYIDTKISLIQHNSKPILCGRHWFGVYFTIVIINSNINNYLPTYCKLGYKEYKSYVIINNLVKMCYIHDS